MKNVIQKLFIGKMPRLDKILNKTIKAASKELAILLVNAATVCL